MDSQEHKEMEQLCLIAEMSRPLVHECNNFLNNLFLQMAIWGMSVPESMRSELGSIQIEGKKLAQLMQQWQRERRHLPQALESIDCVSFLKEIIDSLTTGANQVAINFAVLTGPGWFTATKGDARRLLQLVLRHAITTLAIDVNVARCLEIRITPHNNNLVMHLQEVNASSPILTWAEFDEQRRSSTEPIHLAAVTAKSLAERLRGRLGVEETAKQGMRLWIELPAAS